MSANPPGTRRLHLQTVLHQNRVRASVRDEGVLIRIIFLTGHGDTPTSVRAIKAGETDSLTKPVDAAALVQAVRAAARLGIGE